MLMRLSILAFYAQDGTGAVLESLQGDRRMMRSKVRVNSGGLGGATKYLAEHDGAQLLIVEAMETGEALFDALGGLSEVCSPQLKVVLMGQQNDISLYKQIIDMGLSDYIHSSASLDQLISTIESLFAEEDTSRLARVIAFIGARGGVGSTTVATNTAYSLAHRFDDEAILMDLDLQFGTAALALDLQARQSIDEALAAPDRLDDELMERFLTRVDDRLSIVAASAELDSAADVRFESVERLLRPARRMAGFVVLDLPHRWAPWVNDVMLMADEVVVTAYPDLANLKGAKNLFDRLGPRRGEGAPMRLVFNGVGRSKRSELPKKDFQGALKVAPSASIPFEPAVFGSALNNGEIVAQANKKNAAARQFVELAGAISGRVAPAPARSRMSLRRRTK